MLTRVNANSPFPTESKLYFPVVERGITFLDKAGDAYPSFRAPKHKMLIRSHPDSGEPVCLSVVGENYKVVPNRDLFPYIEEHLTRVIDDKYLGNVTVHEQMSYGGRDCYREYIFNDLKCDVKQGDVSYRAIVGNSYGNKSVTLLSGAIDGWCSNGMIFGVHEKNARKHTSGITMRGIASWIDVSIKRFVEHGKRIQTYEAVQIGPQMEIDLFTHLLDKKHMSKHMVKSMIEDMHAEHIKRGRVTQHPSMWHFYSALTNWASHADVRDTGNDHEANTRIQRSQHVERMIKAANDYVKEAA